MDKVNTFTNKHVDAQLTASRQKEIQGRLEKDLKTPRVSQDIGSCLATMIQDNYNDNIRFYLRDITRAYIEIASDLIPDFDIRPLSELISQLSASFDSIVKVMRPLYGEPEADNHRFTIYHPHYKEKPGMTKSAYDHHLVPHLTAVAGEISQQPSFSLTMAVPVLLN